MTPLRVKPDQLLQKIEAFQALYETPPKVTAIGPFENVTGYAEVIEVYHAGSFVYRTENGENKISNIKKVINGFYLEHPDRIKMDDCRDDEIRKAAAINAGNESAEPTRYAVACPRCKGDMRGLVYMTPSFYQYKAQIDGRKWLCPRCLLPATFSTENYSIHERIARATGENK